MEFIAPCAVETHVGLFSSIAKRSKPKLEKDSKNDPKLGRKLQTNVSEKVSLFVLTLWSLLGPKMVLRGVSRTPQGASGVPREGPKSIPWLAWRVGPT